MFRSGDRFVFTWVAELVFGEFDILQILFEYQSDECNLDTAVFFATLSRTLVIYRRHRRGAAIPLIKIMMRDGECRRLLVVMGAS